MATPVASSKGPALTTMDGHDRSIEINSAKLANESSSSGQNDEEKPGPRERYKLRDLFLVLSILFFSMLAISLLLLAFLFWSSLHIVFEDNGTPELPVNLSRVSNSSYYTVIGPSRVALVSGWASHASFFVMPYFMILFSYFVAREVALKRPSVETIDGTREMHDLLQSLLKGAWREIWTWFKF